MNATTTYPRDSACLAEEIRGKHGLALLDIVSLLKSKLVVEALYLLGIHSISQCRENLLNPCRFRHLKHCHIDLMVLCKKIPPNAIADLSSCIKTLTNDVYGVTLLLHKPSEVRTFRSRHRYFFDQVRQKAWWLGGNLDLDTLMGTDQNPAEKPEHIQQFCEERCRAAKHLLAMEYHLENDTVSLIKVSLMHQAVEQLCIGLIYKFMNYRPGHFHLSYLFDLCSCFTTIAEDVFPRNSRQDLELFRMLCATPHDTRFKKLDRHKLYHVELLEDRCSEFYDLATALIGEGSGEG